MIPDIIVTTDEAAVLVGRSPRTIQAWAAKGLLEPVKLGVGRGHQSTYHLAAVLTVEKLMRQRANAWSHGP